MNYRKQQDQNDFYFFDAPTIHTGYSDHSGSESETSPIRKKVRKTFPEVLINQAASSSTPAINVLQASAMNIPALTDIQVFPPVSTSGVQPSIAASALPPGGLNLISQVSSSLVTEAAADREANLAEEQAKWIPGLQILL